MPIGPAVQVGGCRSGVVTCFHMREPNLDLRDFRILVPSGSFPENVGLAQERPRHMPRLQFHCVGRCASPRRHLSDIDTSILHSQVHCHHASGGQCDVKARMLPSHLFIALA